MDGQKETQSRARIAFGYRSVLRALACLVVALSFAIPISATATDPEDEGAKAYWQTRYRSLHADVTRLRADVARERELYADANRRNYRRGNKRHVHREAMMEAMEELARVEAELATIQEEGRRRGALPGWFYEVDIELEDAARKPDMPAAPDGDGGNPLFDEDDDY